MSSADEETHPTLIQQNSTSQDHDASCETGIAEFTSLELMSLDDSTLQDDHNHFSNNGSDEASLEYLSASDSPLLSLNLSEQEIVLVLPCTEGHLLSISDDDPQMFSMTCKSCQTPDVSDGTQTDTMTVTLPQSSEQWSKHFSNKETILAKVLQQCHYLWTVSCLFKDTLTKLKMKVILREMFQYRTQFSDNVFAITQPRISPFTLRPYVNFGTLKSVEDFVFKLEALSHNLLSSFATFTNLLHSYFLHMSVTLLRESGIPPCDIVNEGCRHGVVNLARKCLATFDSANSQDSNSATDFAALNELSCRINTELKSNLLTVTTRLRNLTFPEKDYEKNLLALSDLIREFNSKCLDVLNSVCSQLDSKHPFDNCRELESRWCLNCGTEFDPELFSFCVPMRLNLTETQRHYLHQQSTGLCYFCGGRMMQNFSYQAETTDLNFHNNNREKQFADSCKWDSDCPPYSEADETLGSSPPPYNEVEMMDYSEEEDNLGLNKLFTV